MSKKVFDKIAAGLDEAALVAPHVIEITRLRAENERLRAALESIVEVCVGAVDYKVKTFSEIYQRNLLHQVFTKASTALKGEIE